MQILHIWIDRKGVVEHIYDHMELQNRPVYGLIIIFDFSGL